MGEVAPVHYLRGNEKVWTPPHVVFLDSETRARQVGEDEILELRLWVATMVDRRNHRKTSGPVYTARGTTSGELAEQIAAWARGRKSLWVYAHNLGFDLVTTALPIVMARNGWRVTDFALRSQTPWVRLSAANTTVTLLDTWGWLAARLDDVAAAYGAHKDPLPDEGDPEDLWWSRCERDVELLAVAMLDLMGWWDRHELGRWTISAAASGWNAFRHRKTPWRMVMDPDPETLARDRLAIRGGRRDAQYVGDLGAGQYVEVDFQAAYATIAANLPLPVARGALFDSLPVDHHAVEHDGWGLLAEVTIRTETPRYPMRWGGVTWYPVGTFKTHLAGPEIAWARRNGDLVAIGPGQFHQLGWALQDWAAWVLRVMSGEEPDSPPVAREAARNWGRSVIGKMAARSSETVTLGPAPTPGWGYMEGRDSDLGKAGAMVDMCGQRYWTVYDTEGENSYPGVLAWVESHVRARLGVLLEQVPPESWVYCDTDGAVLNLTGYPAWARSWFKANRHPRSAWAMAQALCDRAAPVTWPLVPRPKKEHRTMRLMGAQHTITDEDRRLAGVRRDAEETSPWTFRTRDWPSLRWQMARSTPGSYVRPVRTPKLTRPVVHRWITEDGDCWPVWADLGAEGENVLRGWADSWGPVVARPLHHRQYQGLDPLT